MENLSLRDRAAQAVRLSRQVPEPDRGLLLAIAADLADQAEREELEAREGEAPKT